MPLAIRAWRRQDSPAENNAHGRKLPPESPPHPRPPETQPIHECKRAWTSFRAHLGREEAAAQHQHALAILIVRARFDGDHAAIGLAGGFALLQHLRFGVKRIAREKRPLKVYAF